MRSSFSRTLISSLLLFVSQFANSSVVISPSDKALANFPVSYLYDSSAQLTINDVVNQSFTKEINSQFALGYRDGASWFKITITNQ